MKRQHVIPVNDIAKHYNSKYCRCKPEVLGFEDGNLIIVHNAFDAREIPPRILEKVSQIFVN